MWGREDSHSRQDGYDLEAAVQRAEVMVTRIRCDTVRDAFVDWSERSGWFHDNDDSITAAEEDGLWQTLQRAIERDLRRWD